MSDEVREVKTLNLRTVAKEKASLYSSVFDTPNGRLILDDLIAYVGYWGDAFTPGDPCVTAYNCGQRRVVARILNLLGTGHAADMIKDHHERHLANE